MMGARGPRPQHTEQTAIRLEPGLKRKLEEAAERHECTFSDEVRVRLTASLHPESEWLPIKIAPKDGRDILSWDGETYAMIFWCRCSAEWALTSDNCKSWQGATHWMPVPDPPTEAAP
jgi:plasmid stability protein